MVVLQAAFGQPDGALSKMLIYLVIYIVETLIQWEHHNGVVLAVSVPPLAHHVSRNEDPVENG